MSEEEEYMQQGYGSFGFQEHNTNSVYDYHSPEGVNIDPFMQSSQFRQRAPPHSQPQEQEVHDPFFSLPSNTWDAASQQSMLEKRQAAQEQARRARERREKQKQWLMQIFYRLLYKTMPKYFMEPVDEVGKRLRIEQWAINFYYDWMWWCIRNTVITVVFFAVAAFLYPILLNAYQDYSLGLDPTVESFFDARNMYIVNVRQLHKLSPDSFLDGKELEWIRAAPIHRFSDARELLRPVEYVWRNDKPYNITVSALRKIVPENTGTTCLCAAHFGAPLDIAFLGEDAWVQPELIHVGKGTPRALHLVDSLTGPEGEDMWLPSAGRITHLVGEGVARTDLNVRQTACVVRCGEFARKKKLVNENGLIEQNKE